MVRGNAINAETRWNVRADNPLLCFRIRIVGRAEKALEVSDEVKVEGKLEVMRIEGQLSLLALWIHALLGSMYQTVWRVLVQNAFRTEHLQAR